MACQTLAAIFLEALCSGSVVVVGLLIRSSPLTTTSHTQCEREFPSSSGLESATWNRPRISLILQQIRVCSRKMTAEPHIKKGNKLQILNKWVSRRRRRRLPFLSLSAPKNAKFCSAALFSFFFPPRSGKEYEARGKSFFRLSSLSLSNFGHYWYRSLRRATGVFEWK